MITNLSVFYVKVSSSERGGTREDYKSFFLLIALTFVGSVTGVAGDKKAPLSAGV